MENFGAVRIFGLMVGSFPKSFISKRHFSLLSVSAYDTNLPISVMQYTRSVLPHEHVIFRCVNKIIILFVTMKQLKPPICVI